MVLRDREQPGIGHDREIGSTEEGELSTLTGEASSTMGGHFPSGEGTGGHFPSEEAEILLRFLSKA